MPEVVPIKLDVPGEAHLPKEYVEADDARLEAYRRLAAVSSLDELDDLRAEWLDRYGAMPSAAVGLLELARLRLACLDYGVTSVVGAARRAWACARDRSCELGPLTLSAQPAAARAPRLRFQRL